MSMPDPHLRDHFAACALTGLLADHIDHSDEVMANETCEQTVARLAYAHADAMMERRAWINSGRKEP